jgi:YhhN family
VTTIDGTRPAEVSSQVAPRRLATWFVVLWSLWAGSLLAAIAAGNMLGHSAPLATWLRMASSVVLVATAWFAAYVWRTRAVGRFATCIAIGMTLGTIGDFFNAGLLDFVPLSSGTLGGIAAFGLGHVAYIAGAVYLARKARLTNRRALVASIVAWQVFAVVAWYLVVFQGSEHRDLIWPALVYSLLLAGTAGIATGLAAQDSRLWPFGLGAALFLLSDFLLAFELFRGPFAFQTECVWLTYGPGQMFIVFSTIGAALVLGALAQRAEIARDPRGKLVG